MKRGKDDDKLMGPMFPRLNVNDKEKGGPRAPPRNKMALYEQFTIPSQRYNFPQGSNTPRAPSTSTLEGTSHEQNTYFPHYQPQHDEAQIIRPQAENRKVSPVDEDDFMVPIYSQPVTQSSIEKPKNIIHEDDSSELDGANELNVLDHPLEDISLRLSHSPRVTCPSNGKRVQKFQSLENQSIDKGDIFSEASMVTGLDISPDDVVRIIGPKHFWKARSAIATQQRVFAVQIFELHRLIKVQKLIAESPELLLGSAFMGKSSLKGSTMSVKTLHRKSTLKDVNHKSTDKVEGSAENAFTNKSTPMSFQPPPPYPVNMDPQTNLNPNSNSCLSFPQPSPHQWLVPVISPSEGLVYKLHPTSGPYHFGGQGYFPPYGMPFPMPMPYPMPFPMPYPMPMPMNMTSPSMSGSTVEKPYGKSVNLNVMHHKGSMNIPEPPKEGELQGCSASSPSQKTRETCQVEEPTRVIRVVPHKPGCTQESAARIFQSIQEERRQFE